MESSGSRSSIKYEVIIGYVLVVAIMIVGLLAVYQNLVRFSETRVRNEDMSELIIVGNVINQLYEIESTQNLYTPESAADYFARYHSLRPEINAKINSLKQLSKDTLRVIKLDSIEVLLDEKEENLRAIAVLLDSINKTPGIIRETVSTFVPRNLNDQIKQYIERKNVVRKSVEESDTTVVKSEQKGLFKRIGDAIRGKQDSTLIIQNRPSAADISRDNIRLAIDTVVNMVRYSERLNLDSQRKFQAALLLRQSSMTNTNHLLTARIDDLLKSIEQEEINKSIRLIEEKEATLNRSSKTVLGVTSLAILIALVFGLLFLMDINRSQKYRRRLEESNVRINQLLRSREKLMLSISHDIKAPMSSILGYVELMESGADENTRKTYLKNMKKSGNHVLQLVTNLLDYQKIESGTWLRKEMNFNLHELVENTVNSFKPLAEKKQLEYNVVNKVPGDLLVFGDPFMIREIYSNLISNAIKYTLQGTVEVFVEPVNDIGKTILKFSVRDTGLGISEEYQEYIFQEFTQIKPDKIGQQEEGSGLGLAITKGLVDELGGKIHLRSERGKGSEFFVDLPLETSRLTEIWSSGEGCPDFDCENISVLAVDDDPIQLTMLAEMLKLKKINVVTEVDPDNVLNILKNKIFDLIFLDIQMPRTNGFTLVKSMLDSDIFQSKSTPVIALSAKSDLSSADFKQLGFTDFLNKPFTSAQLFTMINKYVRITLAEEMGAVENSKGVSALIDVVKDDRESSLEILRAFMLDTGKNNNDLKTCFEKNDMENAAQVAHKILPLFKMMGDEELSDVLLKLDHEKNVREDEKSKIIEAICQYIDEAKNRISEMDKR